MSGVYRLRSSYHTELDRQNQLLDKWLGFTLYSAFPKNKPYDIKTGYQEYRGNAHKRGNNNKCGNVCRYKNDLHKFVFRPLDAKSLQNICASYRIIE